MNAPSSAATAAQSQTASVLVRDDQGVRSLSLNRPEKMNALNLPLSQAVHAALLEADRDPAVRVVVLSGQGRGFCAGGDLSEFRSAGPDAYPAVEERSQLISRTHVLIKSMRKPVIASVHGFALGGGAALALACDLVLVTDDVKFSYPETRNGIVPALVMPGIQRAVGRKVSFELLALAPALDGTEMLRLGLANRSLPVDRLAEETQAMAVQIATFDPAVMARMKQLFHRMADLSEKDAIDLSREANGMEQMKKLVAHQRVQP